MEQHRSVSPCQSPTSNAKGGLSSSITKMPATLVSAEMTSANWLRTVISPLSLKPSIDLQKFLSSYDKDVTEEVVSRANKILGAIFPTTALGQRSDAALLQNANSMHNGWAQQRTTEALKLYYRVLESICYAEFQLLHGYNLTSLLTNDRFHRCMIACSSEIVLATHKTVTTPLLTIILDKTGITAFDLSKIIQSFIRHEKSLPRQLRRHLNSLEEILLESMVWENGSSLYNCLIIGKPGLAADINHLGLLQSNFHSPSQPIVGGGGQTCAQSGINIFFRKILKVAAVRINGLVKKLKLSDQLRESVYFLFQEILNQRTSLFFNRHIDQIILCCFYGVAKLSQLNLRFKEIMYNYCKQPNCNANVCCTAFVDSSSLGHRKHGKTGQHHVDIITFYNDIFIPSVRPLRVELGPMGAATKNSRITEVSNNNDASADET